MKRCWEFDVFVILAGVIVALTVLAVAIAWNKDRRRWAKSPRHLGSTYDATVRTGEYGYRQNIRLVKP